MAYLIGYIKENNKLQKSIRIKLSHGHYLRGKYFDTVRKLAESIGFEILHPMDKYNKEYTFTFCFYTSLNKDGHGRTGSPADHTQAKKIETEKRD